MAKAFDMYMDWYSAMGVIGVGVYGRRGAGVGELGKGDAGVGELGKE